MTPSAKFGMESRPNDATEVARSTALPARYAEYTPTGMATASAMIWAITISISDFGSFWAMISLTGN